MTNIFVGNLSSNLGTFCQSIAASPSRRNEGGEAAIDSRARQATSAPTRGAIGLPASTRRRGDRQTGMATMGTG